MPLPKKWQSFFIGRKVNHPNKSDLEGVVKYAASTRLGKKNSQETVPGEAITTSFCVELADGTSQVMEDKDVAAIATDDFVKEDWVLDRILKLQECGWNEAKADAAMTKPSANAAKAKSKGQSAKSKSGAAGPSKPGGSIAGPSNTTNAVSLSLQELKRQASSPGAAPPNAKKARNATLPLSSSQEANKQRPQSAGAAAALKKLKTKKKAVDDSSTNDEDTDGNPATTATKPTAKEPRSITFPSSPIRAGAAGGGSGRGGRVLSSMLHVSALAFAKVRGKIVYQYDEVTVDGSKYRVYTKDIVIASNVCLRAVASNGKPADMTIDTWKVREKYEQSEEYFVDCIAAERLTKESKKLHSSSSSSSISSSSGSSSSSSSSSSTTIEYNPAHYEYLLKYTRFELDPGPESWLSYEEVEQTAAYDKWEKTGRKAFEKGMVKVKTAAGLEF